MKTVTVTIGRNVGITPLVSEEWNDFVSRARKAVSKATQEIWAAAPYKGLWEGNTEDAFVFYGPLLDDYDEWPRVVRELREDLRNLASEYGQDAIGLSVGDGELVEAF